jgi:hypothetical protein
VSVVGGVIALVGCCVLACSMLLNVALSLYTNRLGIDSGSGQTPRAVVALRRGTLAAGVLVVAVFAACAIVAVTV